MSHSQLSISTYCTGFYAATIIPIYYYRGNKNTYSVIFALLRGDIVTPSLLLWNDKYEHAPPSIENDARILPFSLKLEPIVDLSTSHRYGFEVLTHLPREINSEKYFRQLSLPQQQGLFYQQMTNVTCFRSAYVYSLNLPMKAFLDWRSFHWAGMVFPPNLAIEIQDAVTFLSLNTAQRAVVYKTIQQIEALGIPIWMDDANEELLTAFIDANWQLSGIKLDKNTFWTLSKKPGRLQQTIQRGQAIANRMIVEGIETHKHKEIALQAGAEFGQGYLWPAIYPGQ